MPGRTQPMQGVYVFPVSKTVCQSVFAAWAVWRAGAALLELVKKRWQRSARRNAGQRRHGIRGP